MPRELSIFVLGASTRRASVNVRLAELVGSRLRERGASVEVASFHEFDSPSFDQDVEVAEGLPSGAEALAARLLDADAWVIVSPEYNHSVPGYLKNVIDWVSRHPAKPFAGHHALLAAASPSMVGGDRGLTALRLPLEALGTHVHPTPFTLAQSHQAWADDGSLANDAISRLLDQILDRFVAVVSAVRTAEDADRRVERAA